MYNSLYIKTDNTFLESMIKVKDLISYAIKNNIKTLAIADNNMHGVMDFNIECINNKITPIIGLEITYKNLKYVLYAKNNQGYTNLLKLNTILSEKEIEIEDIIKYQNNLICVIPYKYYVLYDILKDIYNDIFIGYQNQQESKKIKEKKIYYNEILCLNKEDLEYLKYLYCIKNNEYIDRININYIDNYIIYEQENIENYNYIIENCDITIELERKDLLPIYNDSPYETLKNLCMEGLKKKIGNMVPNTYIERLKMELKTIKDMGFSNYFLIVYDYSSYAKKNNSVAICRGSAAGSLVSYLLNITNMDPIKYNLYFERFLNKDRLKMPDIDMDFEGDIRDKVVKYCIDKYGIKKITPIITFSTLQPKQAINDICKVMDIPNRTKELLSNLIDSRISLSENLSNNKLKEYLNINSDLKKVYEVAQKLEGIKRQSSVHAAGIIMSNTTLDDIIPLKKYHDYYITGIDATYLEKIGLLKMDLLTVRTLDLISNILKEVNIKYDDIDINDKDTIDVFKNGDTLGIFQFEKEGITKTIMKMQPNSFSDIYNAIALYRPGPMQNIDTYTKRKLGQEKINYLHPLLKPILESTYGVIIYQEQIMQIAKNIAGYTLGEADILRDAMSKKKKEVIEKEKEHFIEGCLKKIDYDTALKLYNFLLSFASYGFNKAHSVIYARCAYNMAYLKVHYPTTYFKHLLLNGNFDSKFLYEMKKYKVEIIKPDINLSELDYSLKEGKIIYPLNDIKNVGILPNELIKNRANGYKDIYEIFEKLRNINKENIIPLIKVGVFDSLGMNRKTLINNLDSLLNYNDISTLFQGNKEYRPTLIEDLEYTKKEILEFEYEYLGFYLTSHPVSLYKTKYKSINIKDIDKYLGKYVNIVLYISRINTNKKEKKTCFMTGNDELDSIEIIMFNSIYEQNKDIKKGDIVYIFGKVEKQLSKYEIIVNKIEKLD